MLNYDQRKSAVTNHLGHLLSGYEPPYNLRDDQAKQVREATEVAELIINALPTSLNQNQITATFERAGKELKKVAKSRSWPIAKDILEAIRRATPEPEAEDIEQAATGSLEKAIQYLKETRRAHSFHNGQHIARELIKRGLLQDERDARWRGFDMAGVPKDIINSQRMTLEEWQNHIRVMARLKNCSEADAEKHELFSDNPHGNDTLPKDIARKQNEGRPTFTEHDPEPELMENPY